VWVAHPHGRLAVYRAGRLLWRSRIRNGSDEVAVRGSGIAFTLYRRDGRGTPELWLARVGGHEFRAGTVEEPVGWTPGGLVTVHRSVLRVRGPDATVYRTLGRGHSAIYEPGGTVVFVSRRGRLIRTDGRRAWPIAGGFAAGSWVQRLDDGVLDVSTRGRSVFLRRGGAPLGISAPVDEPAGALGSVIALPHEAGIAYIVQTGRRGNAPGVNVVYVARPHRQARRLYARRVPRLSCGKYASVSYAGGRILYVDDEGPIAVLDPTGRTRPLELTSAFRILQPRRQSMWQLDADWASRWR
jgi:hypothetical protein